jgi:Na+/H+-dicarboxylate symporter
MKFASSLYSFLSNNRYLLPLGVVGITLAMLLLTLLPSDFMGSNKLWSYDKLGHAVLFGSWCLMVGLYYQISYSGTLSPWTIFASGAVLGLLIEILQYLLPLNRHADPIDFLFDVIGCLAAVWILNKIKPSESTQQTSSLS